MRIGMVCYPTYGGSGVLATELGHELAKKGHSVHFITYAQPMRLDRFQDNIYYHEVETPSYPLMEFNQYTLSLAGKILDVAKYEQLDVVHVHYAIPHAVSAYLAREISRSSRPFRLVTTLHGTDITLVGLEPTFLPLVKFSLEKSDIVTAVSGFLAEKTRQSFGQDLSIRVIPNFVDSVHYSRVPCGPLERHLKKDGEFILMHVSNFRPVKRVQDCVRILAEVRKKVNARLVFVGDGPERSDAERLCRDLGVEEFVTFLGKQSALPEILSVADIFLLPSQQESFGLSALEAMSCSVPVVATNIGGIPEVVKHDETGFIAELGDVERMGRYCLDLLINPKKLAIFRENARRRVVDTFDISLIVPHYESVYAESMLMPI
ncbi:MAG: N-acetyl-alpha-D-glucosaminyl L-malate synthase BshA [Candidatus Kapabacteria bacterium]|nr:N-acetyl-alpha-D-glucosaminyl L-malate synthase BshA [Candidatus Kapabacteria bacterium]